MKAQQGIVAILDALGASNYKDREITQFQESRELVLDELKDKAIRKLGLITAKKVVIFTLNDTVVVAYKTDNNPDLKDVKVFGELIRRFFVRSLANGILFRGSIAIGRIYVNSESNTVMGESVADAAAWYEMSDWIGVAATPQATLIIQSLIEQNKTDITRLFVDYSVPLNDGKPIRLTSVNWPKAFFVNGMSPCKEGENKRAKCLELLSRHGVPKGTESKYFNSIAFFDHCINLRKNRKK